LFVLKGEKIMQAQKIITCTDQAGRIVDMPTFQPMQNVELILLFSDQGNLPPPHTRRPPEKLKGLLFEKGDIFSSAPHEDWGII
jgi:hypothetical protein